MAIKAVAGKLPVNLIVVAEGDEERMSIGLRQFVQARIPSCSRTPRRCGATAARANRPRRHQRRQLRRLRLRRDDHQRRDVGPRPDGVATSTAATSAASTARPGGTSRCCRRSSPKTATPPRSTASTTMRCRRRKEQWTAWSEQAESDRPGEAAKNLGVARFMSDDPLQLHAGPQLDFVQSRRHLGRQHVCGRRRRDPAEQDHLEAQHPLRART